MPHLFTRACLLGDGCLGLRRGSSVYLSITHAEVQRDWLEYKAQRIAEELGGEVNVKGPYQYTDERTGNTYSRVNIHICRTKVLKPIYEELYPEGEKLLTPGFFQGLGSEALAVFWMDDGGMNRGTNAGYLNLYTDEEQAKACAEWIKEISSGTVSPRLFREKDRYRLRFITSQINDLVQLIEPYFIPSMKYKLRLTYKSNMMTAARRKEQGRPQLTREENARLDAMTDPEITKFMKKKCFNYTKRGTKSERIDRIRRESDLVGD